MKQYWRSAVAFFLLGGTALLLQARNSSEIIVPHPPLESFPTTIHNWTSVNIPLTKDTLDILGPGDFLLRNYTDPNLGANISLFVAYFPSQRAGDTIHSPKNCLPGSGWTPVAADRIIVNIPGRAPFEVNRYLIAKGDQRQLVLYWYWAHNRAVASEYAAKFYLVKDAITMRRTDGSLVRVSTPLRANDNLESAQRMLLSFAGNIVPLIDAYVPQ